MRTYLRHLRNLRATASGNWLGRFSRLQRLRQLRRLSGRQMAGWGAAAIIVASLALGWVLILTTSKDVTKNPETLSELFLRLAKSGNAHDAYRYTSSDYKAHVTEKDFTTGLVPSLQRQLSNNLPQHFKTVTRKGHSDQVQTLYNVPADGNTRAAHVDLILMQHDGKWSVEGLSAGVGQYRNKPSSKPSNTSSTPTPSH